jgi:hypothetical protein
MSKTSGPFSAGNAIQEGSDPVAALAQAPDHALAISAAAYLDRVLAELLSSQFQELSTEQRALLFEVEGGCNGILARFSSKIVIGYAAGYLTRDRCADLMLVDRVARMFALSRDALTFESDTVRQRCMEFRSWRSKPSSHRSDFNAREIYYQVVVSLYVDICMTIRGDLAWAV